MKKKLVEEYFTFSKKERNAVIVLVMLIVAVFILPYCLPQNERIDDEILAAVEKADITAEDEETENRVASLNKYGNRESNRFRAPVPPKDVHFFTFDPNTLNPEGWRKLGLKERTIQTINNYLFKGGQFKKPEDLRKVFGISPQQAAQLIPYVSIKKEERSAENALPKPAYNKPVATRLIDINEADSATLVTLKGIGPTLAGRIVRFRERLGGFHSKEQLKEVYGLPDSTSQQVLPAVVCSPVKINKININEAGIPDLTQHPYIGRSLARLIVNYREQHGRFEKMEDLLGIDVIDQQQLIKLAPYINF